MYFLILILSQNRRACKDHFLMNSKDQTLIKLFYEKGHFILIVNSLILFLGLIRVNVSILQCLKM